MSITLPSLIQGQNLLTLLPQVLFLNEQVKEPMELMQKIEEAYLFLK